LSVCPSVCLSVHPLYFTFPNIAFFLLFFRYIRC